MLNSIRKTLALPIQSPFSGRRRELSRLILAALAASAASLTLTAPRLLAGTEDSFNGTNLNKSANYSQGGPTSTDDVIIASGADSNPQVESASLAMESLSVQDGSSYTITNSNNGSNYSLSLGGSAGWTNAYSGASDLIYLAGNSDLTLSTGGSGNGALNLALASTGNFDVTTGSALTIAAAITGSSSALTITGGGSVTLSGANTYGGSTTINRGTLYVNGSTASTSAFTVGDGKNPNSGSLAGTGTINGAVAVQYGGTIAPGKTPTSTGSTLYTGNETWYGGGTLSTQVKSDGSENDQLTMSGLTVNTTDGYKFNVSVTTTGGALTLAAGNKLVLAYDSTANSTTFNLGQLTLSTSDISAPSGYSLHLDSASDANGGYDLILDDQAAAPEPTSLILLGAVFSPMMLSRRRRRAACVQA